MNLDRNPLRVFLAYKDNSPSHMLYLAMACALTDKIKVGLDSGAFSAYTLGTSVLLENYMAYIHSLPKKPSIYIQLDVIGKKKETLDNLKMMYENGLKPLPVFTPGMKLTDLEILAQYSKYIAVGGIVGNRASYIAKYLNWLSPALRANKLHIHLLGVSNRQILTSYDFIHSADSTSYITPRNYNQVPFLTETGRLISLPAQAPKTKELLKKKMYEYGIKVVNLDGSRYGYGSLCFYLNRMVFQYATSLMLANDVRYYVGQGTSGIYLGFIIYAYGSKLANRMLEVIDALPGKSHHKNLCIKRIKKWEKQVQYGHSYLQL